MKLFFPFHIVIVASVTVGLITSASAQKTVTPKQTDKNITISCTFENCSKADSFSLYEIKGLTQTLFAKAFPDANGNITFSIKPLPTPRFFALGVNDDVKRLKTLLIGTENVVKLSGPCFDMSQTQFDESKINKQFESAMQRSNDLKRRMYAITNDYKNNLDNEAERKRIEIELRISDDARLRFLDSLKKENKMLERIISLDAYTSYQNSSKKADYTDEVDYFGRAFFQHANLSDSAYNQIPLLVGAFKNYASVIITPELQINKQKQQSYFNDLLNKIPTKTNAHKFALSGIVMACMERNSSLLLPFGDMYLKNYGQDEPDFSAQLNNILSTMRAQMIDLPAPEIAQTDTAGKLRKLSDLKGKYVLLDFWASWCGPCRRENPNVVNMYKKYHDKGFEIFSVSLDRDKSPWLKAITDDGLVWNNHVSDLKFWSNEAAKTYGVQSIPRSVLINKEGIIVAQNLRGEELQNKLKEIFGE